VNDPNHCLGSKPAVSSAPALGLLHLNEQASVETVGLVSSVPMH
jgi:hypothetical protein